MRKKQKGNRIFQIAYDEPLLITRAELLRSRGYEVHSAFGNNEAQRVLDKGEGYDLFIVGHAASKGTREAMVMWLKSRFPDTKILALNPLDDMKLPGADYNLILNGPEAWLAVVATRAP